jgi:hypothetical protein
MGRVGLSFFKDQLREAVPVAQIDPEDSSLISQSEDPTGKGNGFIGIR